MNTSISLFSSQSPDMFTSDGFIFHNDYSLNRFECKTQYLSLRLCLVQLKEELSHGNIISQIMNGNHLKSIKMNISYTQIKWNKIIDLYWCNCFSYHERYSSGFLLSRLIRGVTENFNTFERAKEVENFFSTVSINYYLNIQQFVLLSTEFSLSFCPMNQLIIITHFRECNQVQN